MFFSQEMIVLLLERHRYTVLETYGSYTEPLTTEKRNSNSASPDHCSSTSTCLPEPWLQ